MGFSYYSATMQRRSSLCGSSSNSSSSMHSLSHSRCKMLTSQQPQQLLRHGKSCDVLHRQKQATSHASGIGAQRHSHIQSAAPAHTHAAAAATPGSRHSLHMWRCAAISNEQQQEFESNSTAPPSPAAAGKSPTDSTTPSDTPVPRSSSSSSTVDIQVQHQMADRPPPLQVTRHNFHYALPVLQEALRNAQFYAFDCEMSGLYPNGMEDYTVDDVDDRWV